MHTMSQYNIKNLVLGSYTCNNSSNTHSANHSQSQSGPLTVVVLRRSVVRLVDGGPEALVAAPPSDHVLAGTVEGQEVVAPVDLGHGGLEALQRAGLLQAQRRPQFHRSCRSCGCYCWSRKRGRVGKQEVGVDGQQQCISTVHVCFLNQDSRGF